MWQAFKRNSFIYTILTLVFLCFALHEARADVKGIPHNERFASASFPYARLLDGCTEWRRPERLSDQWGPVSFASACEEHDRCYHTLGQSWGECNQRFLGDLRQACEQGLKQEKKAQGQDQEPDLQDIKHCFDIADLYFVKVQHVEAAKRFELAQRQQAEYFGYVKSVVDGIYRTVMKREATREEQEKALATLTQNYTLDDLKAALMGARNDIDARANAVPSMVAAESLIDD